MTERKYFNGPEIELCCKTLGVDMNHILRNAGITIDQTGIKGLNLTAKESSKVLHDFVLEYGRDDFHLKLADAFVKTPVGPAHLGFAVSTNIKAGIARVTKIKQLSTPVRWELRNTEKSTELKIYEVHPDYALDGYGEIMSFIWVIKSCRNYTLKYVVPQKIVISSNITYREELEKELGCEIEISTHNLLELDCETAELPIITNCDFVANAIDLEASLKLSEHATLPKISALVEQCIRKLLPSGNVTAERVSTELGLSKRTFERRLNENGLTFRKLLDDVKSDLAIQYLSDTDNSIAEISFMLGFEEPNSFSRAFKKWHGSTPNQLRMLCNHVQKNKRLLAALKSGPSGPSPKIDSTMR